MFLLVEKGRISFYTYERDRDIDQERRKYYENLRKENGKGKVWDEKYAEFNSWRLKNEGITNK